MTHFIRQVCFSVNLWVSENRKVGDVSLLGWDAESGTDSVVSVFPSLPVRSLFLFVFACPCSCSCSSWLVCFGFFCILIWTLSFGLYFVLLSFSCYFALLFLVVTLLLVPVFVCLGFFWIRLLLNKARLLFPWSLPSCITAFGSTSTFHSFPFLPQPDRFRVWCFKHVGTGATKDWKFMGCSKKHLFGTFQRWISSSVTGDRMLHHRKPQLFTTTEKDKGYYYMGSATLL